MRCNSTYRFIAFGLAFMMFLSSSVSAVDFHYCGGKLKSFSFFGKAKNCKEMKENNPCMKDCSEQEKMMNGENCFEDQDCCSSRTVHILSGQYEKFSNTDLVVSKQLKQFVIIFVKVFFSNQVDPKRECVNFINYKPPSYQRDIPVLNQSFLL